jgi:hypothetical protein
MPKELIHGMKIILVVVLLLRLIFVSDFSQSDSFSFFAMELNECESEGSDNVSSEDFDEFFENVAFKGVEFSFSSQSLNDFSFVNDVFTHVIEIVPPPPQG